MNRAITRLCLPVLFLMVFAAGNARCAKNFGEPFKAGLAQIFVTDNVRANLDKILLYINRADSQDVDILLFPETALSGYLPYHFPDGGFPSRGECEQVLERIRSECRSAGLWIVLGTTAWGDGERHNMAYLIDGNGEIRGHHSKTHGTGGKYFARGREVRTWDMPGLRCGMQICYDARFPEAWRMQAMDGARVIFHISHAAGGSAWKTPVWEAHVRSRAAENGIWVVSVNCAGPVQAGKSYIAGPRGLLVAESNQEHEELITGIVDPSQAGRGILWSRRPDIYHLMPVDTLDFPPSEN